MKRAVSVVAVVVLLGRLRIVVDCFAGPVNIQFRVLIENPTDEPLTLPRCKRGYLGAGAPVAGLIFLVAQDLHIVRE
jgi:hypothetical protein